MDGSWVVEVRKDDADDGEQGDWLRISECADGQTAIAIADALHNFMGCGIVGDDVRVQVRMVEHKDGFSKRR